MHCKNNMHTGVLIKFYFMISFQLQIQFLEVLISIPQNNGSTFRYTEYTKLNCIY